MSRLKDHPCVPIVSVQQPEEGLCVLKVGVPQFQHPCLGQAPKYSQQAGRAGGSASMGSAAISGSLSATVALLHQRNSERKQSHLGKEKK